MRSLGLGRYALCSCVAAAMLAGCGGSQPPIGALGAMPQAPAIAMQAERGGSWMGPDAARHDLLYVSDFFTVKVYTYPQAELEGVLRGFDAALGECVDSRGNVFVVDGNANQIVEYAHGMRTKRAVLQSPSRHPNGCSVDPTTGNLAVAARGYSSYGTLEVYKRARGTPTQYRDPTFQQFYFCGYDSHGNLFADGATYRYAFAFAELPKGTKTLKNVALNKSILVGGQVQWDGANVAVADTSSHVIYQFTVRGGYGVKVGTTDLGRNAYYIWQFWVQRPAVIVPNSFPERSRERSNVLFYKYSAGGRATKRIAGRLGHYAFGAVVSLARH